LPAGKKLGRAEMAQTAYLKTMQCAMKARNIGVASNLAGSYEALKRAGVKINSWRSGCWHRGVQPAGAWRSWRQW